MYKEVKNCRCCGSAELDLYLDLKEQPLANSYYSGKKDEGGLREYVACNLTYPLKVMVCKRCFHSQLSVVVNPKLMFENYLYVSGTTHTFREHCKDLAREAVSRFEFKHLAVLDIACNDGTLLECFRDLECEVFGVDPAENLAEITKGKNLDVHVGYWGYETSEKIDKKFDIITGTNVFAHVDDIIDFLKGCKNVLVEDGLIILEFPYCDKMIEHVEFDTIYHEHLSYFLVNSFSAAVHRCGLFIKDILTTKIHGGSIRFFLGRKREDENNYLISWYVNEEIEKGLLELDTYRKFSNNVAKNKKDLVALLGSLRKGGYKTIGYGASAKGNTMLNHFKIDLDYIVDDNPLKHGYYTPGQNIVIKPPQVMAEEDSPLAIVILSWNFYSEIKKKIETIRGVGRDKYILYVPEVKAE